MNFRWSLAAPQPLLANQLITRLKVSPLTAQCLLNRGLGDPDTAAQFLEPRLKSLADPFAIPNLRAAVQRLLTARDRNEPLVIFGDYDVDGVCSAAILVETLTALGWSASAYLPHRFDEGYGLTREGVENCLQKHPASLLLAVDCGSTAVETITDLRARGIDVIVLDHHQISQPPPPALALVNPQVAANVGNASEDHQNAIPAEARGAEKARVPFSELCSAGLAFKLAHALVKTDRQAGRAAAQSFDIRELLDLVALATIADLVPLIGENRILVQAGLRRLAETTRPGLIALKEVAGITGATLGSFDISHGLAPRLNAAGRLETAAEALNLVTAATRDAAMPIAQSLDARNRERQDIERHMADQVIASLRQRFDPARDFAIVEGEMLWHIGVVGIVASRVQREFYRPTIILGGDGHLWRGSGRSIEGLDLAAGLRACSDLLERHGGHAMAAGLSITPQRVNEFRARLNQLVQESLSEEQLRPALRLDAEVTPAELHLDLMEELARLQPVGQGNPPVQVVVRGLRLDRPPRLMGREQQHAKLSARAGGVTLEIVWWRCEMDRMPKGAFDLACVPEINEFNGRRTLQLRLLDWRPA
jgi:single-stranded-DNA-specific exonuclease